MGGSHIPIKYSTMFPGSSCNTAAPNLSGGACSYSLKATNWTISMQSRHKTWSGYYLLDVGLSGYRCGKYKTNRAKYRGGTRNLKVK